MIQHVHTEAVGNRTSHIIMASLSLKLFSVALCLLIQIKLLRNSGTCSKTSRCAASAHDKKKHIVYSIWTVLVESLILVSEATYCIIGNINQIIRETVRDRKDHHGTPPEAGWHFAEQTQVGFSSYPPSVCQVCRANSITAADLLDVSTPGIIYKHAGQIDSAALHSEHNRCSPCLLQRLSFQ